MRGLVYEYSRTGNRWWSLPPSKQEHVVVSTDDAVTIEFQMSLRKSGHYDVSLRMSGH